MKALYQVLRLIGFAGAIFFSWFSSWQAHEAPTSSAGSAPEFFWGFMMVAALLIALLLAIWFFCEAMPRDE